MCPATAVGREAHHVSTVPYSTAHKFRPLTPILVALRTGTFCLLCAAFCLLFTFRFGGDVGESWALAWIIATVTGAFIIQPLTTFGIACLTHGAVWMFANHMSQNWVMRIASRAASRAASGAVR